MYEGHTKRSNFVHPSCALVFPKTEGCAGSCRYGPPHLLETETVTMYRKTTRAVFTLLAVLASCADTGIAQRITIREISSLGESEESFVFQIGDVKIGEDGSIYIADVKRFSVSKFSREGKFLKKVGRHGEGPGEFRQAPKNLALRRDTLFVGDGGVTRMMHLFSADLDYLSSFQVSDIATGADVDDQNNLYVSYMPSSLFPEKKPFEIYTPDGELKASLGMEDLSKYSLVNAFNFRIDEDGFVIVVFGFQNRIQIHDPSGKLVKQFSIPGLPQTSPLRERKRSGIRNSRANKLLEKVAYVPEEIIFRQMALDHRAHIYIQGGDYSEKGEVYILNHHGELINTFTLPPGHLLKEIDHDGFLYATSAQNTLLKKYELVYHE